MAVQRSLWGYEVDEAVEVKLTRSGWQVATVTAINQGHRGLTVVMADTRKQWAVSSPKSVRKIPRGEDLIAWLDS